MITPDHIKFNKGMRLTLHAMSKGCMESLYEFTRIIDGNIKKGLDDDSAYYYDVTSGGNLKYMYDSLGGIAVDYSRGRIVPVMRIELVHHIKDDQIKAYEHKTELILTVGHHVDGITIPVRLHYPISYAMVTKDRVSKSSEKLIDIEFYDADNNLVAHVIQDDDGDYWQEIRCRAGKFIYDAGLKTNKNKKETGGCFYCDNAVYKKENGIVYLACTKYGGQVAETTYDGVGYPEYCKRRA